MKFAHLIWGNLTRRKLRTSLTLLSIVVAFVLFGLLCAVRQALEGGVKMAGVDRLIVRHRVSLIQLLPESYKARIERIPGIELAMHQTWFGGVYQDPKNFFPQAPVVPEEFLTMKPELVLSAEHRQAWLTTRTGAIVGRSTADRFNWKIGDKIPIQSPLWGRRTWDFDLVGIYDGREAGTDTRGMFFRYDYFDESRQEGQGKGMIGWYTIRVKDPARAAEIARRVDEEFENSAAETKTEPEGAFVQGFARQIGNIGFIVGGILVAVFFTLLLVTGSTMAQAVRERLGELGVLKAIGFTNGQVLTLVLAESCLLAVLGGGLGLSLACLVTSRGDPTGGLLPLFYLRNQDLALGGSLSLALGLLTGIFPAWQAMRLRVAEALRRL